MQGAESELKRVRNQMYQLALPMYQQTHPDETEKASVNEVVSQVLAKIAGPRLPPASAAAAHLRTKVADLRRKEILGVGQYRVATITASREGRSGSKFSRRKVGCWRRRRPSRWGWPCGRPW